MDCDELIYGAAEGGEILASLAALRAKVMGLTRGKYPG
jgi:hypothetical protein